MKPGLAAIQEFVQQVVEAIAVAIGVEVMVFDPARNTVAGTGETKVEVGNQYNPGSLTGRLLVTGQPIIARNPGISPECMPCSRYGTCPHYVVLAYPMKIMEEIMGSLCLVAVDETQKQHVLANEANLIRFLDRMCLLIGSAISERKNKDEMGILLRRYDNVVNSVHEGIIATDDAGRIIHFNRSASNLLGIEASQALGKPLADLFPDLPGFQGVPPSRILQTEVSYQHKGRQRYFLATVAPVLAERSQLRGVTISLKKLSEIQSYATKLVGEYSRYSFQDIHGESAGIRQAKEKLNRAALTDSTVLILGESGTGKELFAHAVHSASHRARGPLVAINCSAIPESLLESEFFGYAEGAFTGAKKGGKPGKFELAGGGTLFLDEIGDMPLHLQSKLLRVLENRCIERVGGTESLPIDVRIIAATNRNIEEMVKRREFRGDLYYRLSVIPVFIPPLRERPEDIPDLIAHFLAKYSVKLERDHQELDTAAQARLNRYTWPGNVRELQNAIEYAINMSEPCQPITEAHLPQKIFDIKQKNNVAPASINTRKSKSAKAGEIIPSRLKSMGKTIEEEAIRDALSRFGTTTVGKENAARYLGISRSTLYRRLKELDCAPG